MQESCQPGRTLTEEDIVGTHGRAPSSEVIGDVVHAIVNCRVCELVIVVSKFDYQSKPQEYVHAVITPPFHVAMAGDSFCFPLYPSNDRR